MAKLSWPGFSLANFTKSATFFTGKPGWATKIEGEVDTMVKGVKSLIGSNGKLGYSDALMAWLVKLINNVLPSGAALATMSAAKLPPAPGLFSTTTTRPSCCPKACAKVRAMVSVVPPAGAPTKIRTGTELAVCACATPKLIAASSPKTLNFKKKARI